MLAPIREHSWAIPVAIVGQHRGDRDYQLRDAQPAQRGESVRRPHLIKAH
jgi:hypothetical protein